MDQSKLGFFINHIITINGEVYTSLMRLKRENESFSDLLERLIQKLSSFDILRSLRGLLDLGKTDSFLDELSERRTNWR